VPSPTAATLHALHYHQVDVFARQREIAREEVPPLAALLTLPLARDQRWSEREIVEALENNAQGAYSGMSCAGSTRGWDAPRCPISTMSA